VASVKEAKNALLASRRAVLTTHLNADGDGAGSQAAVAGWLRANGTEAWIINPTGYPDAFGFLLEDPDWVVPSGSRRARDLCDSADIAVVLDTGDVSRVGRVYDMIRDLSTVIVDHHPTSDQPIRGLMLQDTAACATGELVFDVIHAANGPWTLHVAESIYVAILTDTGGFRFDNTSPTCHEIVAEVIRMGVHPESLHERVYGRAPLRKYRLLRHALETLEHDPETGVSWMTIPKQPFDELGATAEDLEGIVDIPRSITGTEVGLLFRHAQSGEVKISFRSNGQVDVNALARRFKGGGHVKASGAMVAGPMDRAIAEVLSATRAAVVKATGDGEGQ
jgi:phosphoesterase RecJ-like protein